MFAGMGITSAGAYLDPQNPLVARVPIGSGKRVGMEAIVDADLLPLVQGACCCWSETKDWAFVSYTRGEVKGVPLRRLVLGVDDERINVRHVNGDPLDCRRANLVTRTVGQRVRSARKRKATNGQPCTSRFKGVFWETWTNKWRACISCGDIKRKLGRFHDEIAAAQAYDEAARELFGEHARLNFPDGVDAFLMNDAEHRAAA